MATQANYTLRGEVTLARQWATFWHQNCHLNLLIKRANNTKSCQVAGWRILSFKLSSKYSTSVTAMDYHLKHKKAATSSTFYSASIWKLAILHLGDSQENLSNNNLKEEKAGDSKNYLTDCSIGIVKGASFRWPAC